MTRYPNVSGDRRPRSVRVDPGVVDNVTFAISIVGTVALASGALILIGAVAMTKFQRVYEAAILRTLGASTRMLGTMLALEYSALGLIAGLIGAAGSLALSWAVCRFVFEIDWTPAPVAAAGRDLHDRAGRRHRHRRQRRRPEKEAAGDAAGRNRVGGGGRGGGGDGVSACDRWLNHFLLAGAARA